MAIQKPSFSTNDGFEGARTVIPLLASRPQPYNAIDPPVRPNSLVGFFDPSRGAVELYVSSPDGSFYMRVVA